jgi:hypothetical protein
MAVSFSSYLFTFKSLYLVLAIDSFSAAAMYASLE